MAVTINGTTGIVTPALDNNGNLDVDGGTIKLDGNYPTGTDNVALGDGALDDGSLTGDFNTAIGNDSLTANTSGNRNTAVGDNSLRANTTGVQNTSLGRASFYSNTDGDDNVGVGFVAGFNNTTGSDNVAVGGFALYSNTTASNNTAVGYQSLYANTTGTENTAVGSKAGDALTTGSNNTFIGNDAGHAATTGTVNTFIGHDSGYSVTTGSGNTIIGRYSGNQGGLDIRTSSNNIVLSDGDGNPRQIFDGNGNIGINENPNASFKVTILANGAAQYMLRLNTSNTSGTQYHLSLRRAGTEVGSITTGPSSTSYNTTSDYRLKENVTDITDGIDRLKQLPVHKFNFIADPDTTVDGFLAHEAQAVVPEAVTGAKDEVDDEGNPVMQGIDQSKLVPLLTAALKEAITEIETLKERVTALENQ